MLVSVRPSNEALLRARVPGAQDQRGCSSNPFHRGGSASKKGTCLCSPTSWLLQKQSHCHLLSLDPGPAERLDHLAGQYFRHFYQ